MILGEMILAQVTLELSHFSAALLFSVFASIVFGITQRSQPKMMIRFGAFCFVVMVRARAAGNRCTSA